MPVVSRGSGYQATVHHKGERFRRQFNTQAEAVAWEAQAKASLLRGELPDMGEGESGAPATLETLKDLTHRRFWIGTKAEETAVRNASICIRDIGNISPSKVTTQTIDAVVFKWQDEGKSNATINRRLSALSKMLKFAKERGYITSVPKIDRKREGKGRIRFFTPQEEQEIIQWFEFTGNKDMAELVVVAIDTGMRRGELLRIEGRDVNDTLINIWETKSSHPRTVPMTQRVKNILHARKERLGEGLLFPNVTEDSIRYAWDIMRENKGQSDDPQFVFHTLRHTFVSRLVQRGVNLKQVSELAGHTNIATTMRYAHLAPRNLVDAIKVLEPA